MSEAFWLGYQGEWAGRGEAQGLERVGVRAGPGCVGREGGTQGLQRVRVGAGPGRAQFGSRLFHAKAGRVRGRNRCALISRFLLMNQPCTLFI